MDLISLVTGAALLGAGLLVGYWRGRRARRPAPEPKPVCGCEHHMALHDRETGVCNGAITVELWNRHNERAGRRQDPCPCRQYVGPEPITSVWAPPLLAGHGRAAAGERLVGNPTDTSLTRTPNDRNQI